jgi:hypothetical protein
VQGPAPTAPTDLGSPSEQGFFDVCCSCVAGNWRLRGIRRRYRSVSDQETAELNHYQLLGVPVDAPTETIRRAWLLRIRRSHPDRHSESPPEVRDSMARRSAELNAAWSILRDERRRLDYDLGLSLRPSRCSGCGDAGFLRRHGELIVAACATCWAGRTAGTTNT